MKTVITAIVVSTLCLSACASSRPATASSANDSPQAATTKPDATRAQSHLEKHVSYPATRDQILAACATTPEFSTAEKRWFEQNLPEGNYRSSAEVVSALEL